MACETFEAFATENGFDPAALSEAQKKPLLAAWKASVVPAPDNPGTGGGGDGGNGPPPEAQKKVQQAIAAERAKLEREEKIAKTISASVGAREITVEVAETITARAYADGWTIEQVQLEILRARRPMGPNVIVRHEDPALSDDVMEAAVCAAGGLSDLDQHFGERTLEATRRRYRHGLSLGDLVLSYAKRGGYDGLSLKANLKGALQAAFSPPTPEIRANSWGPSTGGGLSGVLSNVANKFLRAGFESVDMAWKQIAAIRSVTDFKEISTYSLTGGLTFEPLPPGGEIKHGQLGAEVYTNRLDTYAKMIGIDRRDLINDDLGALTGVSRRLGRGGAIKLNNIFWTAFLNNSAFFTSGRGNVSTGAGSALSIAGLDTAYQKFVGQTDPDGEPLGSTPAILLVPTALKATAEQLMSSTMLNQTPASNAAAGMNNPWAGMFQVVSSPYMSNAGYTGYSASAWYLLASPSDLPVIEVVLLNGQESPTIESTEADFNQLGIALRGYHDAGARLQEYRGGVRSAGS